MELNRIYNREITSFDIGLVLGEMLKATYGEQIRGSGALLVNESELFVRSYIFRMQSAGADTVIMGKALMR